MKFFLLSGIISLIVLGFKQPDCSNFKTGKFKIVDVSINDSFIIDRTDSLQIETDLKSGEISTFRVHWLDDCNYTLTIVKGPPSVMQFYFLKTLRIQIIETFTDGYKFKASLDGMNVSYYQTMKRI